MGITSLPISSNVNGPAKRTAAPSVSVTRSAPTNYKTAEGTAARKLVTLIDKMTFSETTFAYLLKVEGGNLLRRRILDIAFQIIEQYAGDYDRGHRDGESIEAKYLQETLILNKLGGFK